MIAKKWRRSLTTLTQPAVPTRQLGALAGVALLGVSTMLPGQILARNSLLSGEGSTTIDAQIKNGTYVIPNTLFGMHINSLPTPWPLAYFANQRLEGSNVNWWNLEPSPGDYNYFWLDQWVAQAQQHGVTLMYTFAAVPQFYSSVPSDTTCSYEPGACHPPKDLNEDGTGTDAAFQNFVTDLVRHNALLGKPIQYWEIWNEPDQAKQWIPSCVTLNNCKFPLRYTQLLRMAKDASAIIKAADPNAVVLTPAPVGYIGGATAWMNGYLKAGGGQYADVISFHGYLNQWIMGRFPVPENEYKLIQQMKAVVKANGQSAKPLWVSEGGWGNVVLDGFSDQVLQSAFLSRYILLQQSLGIARGYWYQWDSPFGAGTLWQGPMAGNINLSGYAYNSIVNWTMGATLTRACSQHKYTDVWVCEYARSSPVGYKAVIAWNPKGNYAYFLPGKFPQYCDLKGSVVTVKGNKVQVGIWPILLEDMNLGSTACQQ